MTTRERCMNILHYKNVDRMPALHFGYWPELLGEWAEQGHISKELAVAARRDGSEGDRELDKLVGWDCNWFTTVGTRNRLLPSFEKKVLEVLPDGSHRVVTPNGVIEKIKPGIVSIPSEDDYLLKDREAFETLFKPKMQFSPKRVDFDFFKRFNETRNQEIPIGLHIGSVMGQIRDITTVMGMWKAKRRDSIWLPASRDTLTSIIPKRRPSIRSRRSLISATIISAISLSNISAFPLPLCATRCALTRQSSPL